MFFFQKFDETHDIEQDFSMQDTFNRKFICSVQKGSVVETRDFLLKTFSGNKKLALLRAAEN
jgi:hypothetical protein